VRNEEQGVRNEKRGMRKDVGSKTLKYKIKKLMVNGFAPLPIAIGIGRGGRGRGRYSNEVISKL